MKSFFDLLVTDEVHEYKGRGSAQGIAAGVLADACGKSLSLSGTLMGGYSSTLFHLLYRFSPEIRTEFGRSDEGRWIKRYGFEEHTIGRPDDGAVEDGRNSRRRKFRKVVQREARTRSLGAVPHHRKHGLSEAGGRRIRAAGLRGADPAVWDGHREADGTGYSQRSAYDHVFEKLRKKLTDALKSGSKRLLATYLQTLLAYPDGCTRGRDGVRSPDGRHHRSGTSAVGGQAVPEGAGAHRPGGRRAAGGAQSAGVRHPHRDARHHRAYGRLPHQARLSALAVMKADAVAPDKQGEVGRGQGEARVWTCSSATRAWCRPDLT